MRGWIRNALIGWAVVRGLVEALRRADVPSDRPTKERMRRPLPACLAILGVLGMLGFLVAAIGIIPIRASDGHWAITRWFLDFSKRRSVSLHSMRIDVPPLRDRALVVKGAAAYDQTCRPCHGSPGSAPPRVVRAMLPKPPHLPDVVARWSPAELFYITKHGIKFTGMPAWPAQGRDDEVWAVVAFLLEMPKLDAASYRALSGGARVSCARCHGANGEGGAMGAVPRLAGQRRTYIANALRAYASGRRHSGVMEPVAAALAPAQIEQMASHFSSVAVPTAPSRAAPARGIAIATRGIPSKKVPPCADCHGPSPVRNNDAYPRLGGQSSRYLVLQLELFRSGKRGGSAYAHLMRPVAAALTPEEMRDVALYYESLGR